jgi:phospholipase/lecithinase/hemolysin
MMKNSRSHRRIVQVTLLVSLTLLSLMFVPGASARPFTQLVVFGDSLSDSGNLFSVTGGAIPPSPPYFDGRFSNGPVWADFLATELRVPVQNYAFGGALTGRANHFDNPGIPAKFPGLLDEIDIFLALNGGIADPHALYVVWAGANDFFLDPEAATIAPAVTNLVTAIQTLISLGARHIVVPTMPDLGLTPDGRESGFSSQLTALSVAFNRALKAGVSGLGVTTFDTFALFREIVADPADFGFGDVTTACLHFDPLSLCADPDTHLFWDGVHPTTRGHEILADELHEAVHEHAERHHER